MAKRQIEKSREDEKLTFKPVAFLHRLRLARLLACGNLVSFVPQIAPPEPDQLLVELST